MYVKSQIDALNTATYQNIQTAFSAQTSANQIQDIIDLKLDKRRKVISNPHTSFRSALPLTHPCCHCNQRQISFKALLAASKPFCRHTHINGSVDQSLSV